MQIDKNNCFSTSIDTENDVKNATKSVENMQKNAIKCDEKCKKFARINGRKLAFYFYGKGEKTIVFLHGWGANADAWRFVANEFCENFKVLIIDFYGFGDSDYPPQNYGVKEYASDVVKLLNLLNIESAIFVGHSFGGRVALEICANYPHIPQKLVLVDSAGIKPRRSVKYYCKIALHKLLKKLGKQGLKGSSDYSLLSNEMKEVFKRVVNYHQNGILQNIECQTAVFWGDNDKETPMYMYKYFLKYIKNSYGVVLHGGHFAYVEDYARFLAILKAFFE